MKFFKVLIPVLTLALSGGGLLIREGATHFSKASAAAMSSGTGDMDLDFGLNLTASASAQADYTISQFYIDNFASRDVSGGDYLAVRMRCNPGAGSWYDIIPNVSGNAWRVPLTDESFGLMFCPAGEGAVAFTHNGFRTWDLPMNIWDGSDGYVMIPKSGLTRNYFGSAINWNDNLSAIYFLFYGTTIDTINFDIGDIWTANLDGAGHMVKVNHILNWSNVPSGTLANDSGNLNRLNVVRNNTGLMGAAGLYNELADNSRVAKVDACNQSAAATAVTANKDAYSALDSANLNYFRAMKVTSYRSKDTSHAQPQDASWTMGQYWDQLVETSGVSVPTFGMLTSVEDNKRLIAILISTISVVAAGSFIAFVLKRKHRA